MQPGALEGMAREELVVQRQELDEERWELDVTRVVEQAETRLEPAALLVCGREQELLRLQEEAEQETKEPTSTRGRSRIEHTERPWARSPSNREEGVQSKR